MHAAHLCVHLLGYAYYGYAYYGYAYYGSGLCVHSSGELPGHLLEAE